MTGGRWPDEVILHGGADKFRQSPAYLTGCRRQCLILPVHLYRKRAGTMQNPYTGDIGDYVKYGLLRALAEGRRLGVA